MRILTVNVGSSSVRLAMHAGADEHFHLVAASKHALDSPLGPEGVLARFVRDHALGRVDAVVHRIVHGGIQFREVTRLDKACELALEALSSLAPLHTPQALRWIRASRTLAGDPIQLAVFDTTFFAGLPEIATTYALPRALVEAHGIRRFGFHGLAHQSMLRALPEELAHRGRIITLQLGSGCSAAAIRAGRPIDTSMGFSPLEGLVMGTRAGDVDAGALLQVLRDGVGLDELERALSESSGLLGISGISSDVRTLRAHPSPDAKLALQIFAMKVRKYVGAFLAELGGAEAIVFGGGIGEHDPEMRAAIVGGLEELGLVLDAEANRTAGHRPHRISADSSRVSIWITAVDESREMLIEAAPLLEQPSAQPVAARSVGA